AAVRLNVVVPGQTNTPLYQGVLDHPLLGKNVDNINVPLGRVIAPEEIAEYIELMLGSKMQCLHGSVLWADCGADAAARPDRF
ncbi:MAG: SDR family oxidoreductase, partial [Parvibaculales bacterium]